MWSGNTKYLAAVLIFMMSAASIVSAQNRSDEDGTEKLAGLNYWNNIDKETITTESGLQYKILIEGKGSKPKPRGSATVHYRGLLLNGVVFDSSFENDEPVKLKLGSVIDGWKEGLQLMPKGSVYVFLIPPELAYGERSAGGIPPNSTLIFEVELFKTK